MLFRSAQLVRRLNEEGRTVVWITHNMAEAAEVARRVIVLKDGRVLLDGPPQEVFSEEETLMTAHLTPPPAARLVRELRRRGWDIEAAAVTAEEAAGEILGYLASSGKEGGHV